MSDTERIPTICFCGRTHAPWWGRHVPAPSCDLKPADEAMARFLAFRREERERAA